MQRVRLKFAVCPIQRTVERFTMQSYIQSTIHGAIIATVNRESPTYWNNSDSSTPFKSTLKIQTWEVLEFYLYNAAAICERTTSKGADTKTLFASNVYTHIICRLSLKWATGFGNDRLPFRLWYLVWPCCLRSVGNDRIAAYHIKQFEINKILLNLVVHPVLFFMFLS